MMASYDKTAKLLHLFELFSKLLHASGLIIAINCIENTCLYTFDLTYARKAFAGEVVAYHDGRLGLFRSASV